MVKLNYIELLSFVNSAGGCANAKRERSAGSRSLTTGSCLRAARVSTLFIKLRMLNSKKDCFVVISCCGYVSRPKIAREGGECITGFLGIFGAW